MKISACCFTGHRIIPVNELNMLSGELMKAVEELILQGVTDFYAGGAIGFDMLAAEAVLKLRNKYSRIKLHIIIPCENQEKMWSKDNKERYRRINDAADEVKCLSPVYFNGCMQVRNRYLVDNSDILIAYMTKSEGGTASTVKYADRKGKTIINLTAQQNI